MSSYFEPTIVTLVPYIAFNKYLPSHLDPFYLEQNFCIIALNKTNKIIESLILLLNIDEIFHFYN